jgi:7-cyano-7-deazaguanine synthase
MRGRRVAEGPSVVLLSGGMDSATCLAIAAARGPVHALSVRYGQRHARELGAARALARYYQATGPVLVSLPLGPLLDSDLTRPERRLPVGAPRGGSTIPTTYVPARNTILLSVALGYAESHRVRSIYLGVNAVDYSGYPDCRPEFLTAFRHLARLATREGVEGRPIRILAPLLHMTKAEIVRTGERLGVPWALTWSCYAGGERPCGRCDACRLRRMGFAQAGVKDPLASGRGPRSLRTPAARIPG